MHAHLLVRLGYVSQLVPCCALLSFPLTIQPPLALRIDPLVYILHLPALPPVSQVSFPPYIFELDLHAAIDDAQSRAVVGEASVRFHLLKAEPGTWPDVRLKGYDPGPGSRLAKMAWRCDVILFI